MTNNKIRLTEPVTGLHELWDKTRGNARICVAILDGPVNMGHPCFSGARG